jgi:hypothetical protein
MTEAAADGMEIACAPDRSARPCLDSGKRVTALGDWRSAFPALFLSNYPRGQSFVDDGLLIWTILWSILRTMERSRRE